LGALIFNQLQHGRLRVYFFTFLFQGMQGFNIYVFKFNCDNVLGAAKSKHGFIIAKITLNKMRSQRMAWSISCRI